MLLLLLLLRVVLVGAVSIKIDGMGVMMPWVLDVTTATVAMMRIDGSQRKEQRSRR